MIEIKRKELDVFNNSYPYMIYHRFEFNPSSGLSLPRLSFNYEMPNGMNFIFSGLRAKAEHYNYAAAQPCPELFFEFFSSGNSRTRQANPVTAFHYCPNYSDSTSYGTIASPALKQEAIKNFCFEKKLNWFYTFGSNIRLDVTGQTKYNASYTLPMCLDVILMGEMIPLTEAEKWGKK